MRLTVLSDTHDLHQNMTVPDADLVIHCGDATNRGTEIDLYRFLHWYSSLPIPNKIYVPGNHDWDTQRRTAYWQDEFKAASVTMLVDQSVDVLGMKIHGTPWSVQYGNWAWMAQDTDLAKRYNIDPETKILVSHGPPYGLCDLTESREHAGSKSLLAACDQLPALQLMLVGHIHESAGSSFLLGRGGQTIHIANCAQVSKRLKLINPVRMFDI